MRRHGRNYSKPDPADEVRSLALMSTFLELIEENSVDLALQMLKEKGDKVSNANHSNGVSALMLATKVEPTSKAILLIDALMKAGASLDKWANNRRDVFLYACEAGVDPIVFNAILNWSSYPLRIDRTGAQHGWSINADNEASGVFILACKSGNFDLIRHVLSTAHRLFEQKNILGEDPCQEGFYDEEYNIENFLETRSNHILRALEVAVGRHEESFALRLLCLLSEFIKKVPDKCRVVFYNPKEYTNIYLSNIVNDALNHGMFSFIVEYGAIFSSNRYFKQNVWNWVNNRSVDGTVRVKVRVRTMFRYTTAILTESNLGNIPFSVLKLALSYENNCLWEKNKDLALVLLRTLKDRRNNDVLNYISSFIYCFRLDVEWVNIFERIRRDKELCCDCRSEIEFVGSCDSCNCGNSDYYDYSD